MIVWIITGALIVLCAAIILVPSILFRRASGGGESGESSELDQQSQTLETQIHELTARPEDFASHTQVESLRTQVSDVRASVEAEQSAIVEIEARLKKVTGDVEQKEANQQSMKSSSDADDVRVEQMLGTYTDSADAAISLEQALARSLKDIDTVRGAVKLNADQNATFQLLSDSFELASSRLRDLLTEYETIHRRVSNLKTQKEELEEEYTRLVERQLGN